MRDWKVGIVAGLTAVGVVAAGLGGSGAAAPKEDRLKALEERVEDLELEVDALRYRCRCG